MEKKKGIHMSDSINQQVIDFTADYTGNSPESINDLTTLASLGLVTEQDVIQYIVELEQFFGLSYEQGDETGILTVGDAVKLIEKKLGQ
jgi:acyl carrier protein